MKDDNYYAEQRDPNILLDLGEIKEIADDISAVSMTLYFHNNKLTSIDAKSKFGINNHIMFKLQKLYNLDVVSINPCDEELVNVIMNYTGNYESNKLDNYKLDNYESNKPKWSWI